MVGRARRTAVCSEVFPHGTSFVVSLRGVAIAAQKRSWMPEHFDASQTMLTTDDCARIFLLTRKTIYKLVRDGRLRGVRVGRVWRFSRTEVERVVLGDAAAGRPD